MYIYIYIYTHTHTYIYKEREREKEREKERGGLGFHQWSGRPGFNPTSSLTKDFKKWYLIPTCLTLSITRYVSRVKWSNPGKGVVPSSTHRCSSYWIGSFQVALDYSLNFTLLIYIYIYICVCVCVWLGSILLFKDVWKNNKNFFFSI